MLAIDTDNDGLPDDWELANGRDPLVADYAVSSGTRVTCALDDTGVVCWGNDGGLVTNVPSLNNPTQVSSSHAQNNDEHTCALDDTGVVCWGDNNFGQTTVPSLINPTQVSTNNKQTCALDDTGVICWGRNDYGQTIVPSLVNPTLVSAGWQSTCALDDTGVVCWGNNDGGQTTGPSLVNPTQLSSGYNHYCALDDTGVICWGANGAGYTTWLLSPSPSIVPTLANPIQVSTGLSHTCALEDKGVLCWGENSDGQSIVPNLVIDPDGDGYSNQGGSDAFPLNASEWLDTDSDGVGNNADAFPNDSSESIDTDSDGIGNNADQDDDGDGVSDASDAFPLDASEQTDTDGDGVGDNADALPNDASETQDSDGDGVGNNSDNCNLISNPNQLDTDGDATGNACDSDDDNDGMSDVFEVSYGFDPLDASDANADSDGDSETNLFEFNNGTDPTDATSFTSACLKPELDAPVPSNSSFMNEKKLYIANPGSNTNQQTFLRFINNNSTATDVELYAIDDAGTRSKKDPITFTLPAQGAKQMNAQDIENGNANKGITKTLCDGQGKWQLVTRSSNPIEVMGLIRTPDGFLTSLNDAVPEESGSNIIYFANPASNTNQQTFVRVVNTAANSGTVTITGIDDSGAASSGAVSFTLEANEAKQMTIQDLENGNINKGLSGSLGDGTGKWRLTVTSALDLWYSFPLVLYRVSLSIKNNRLLHLHLKDSKSITATTTSTIN